jgi:hypothetical protein
MRSRGCQFSGAYMEQTKMLIEFNIEEPTTTLAQIHGILTALGDSQKWKEALEHPDCDADLSTELGNAKHHVKRALGKYSFNIEGCYVADGNPDFPKSL